MLLKYVMGQNNLDNPDNSQARNIYVKFYQIWLNGFREDIYETTNTVLTYASNKY